MLRSLVKPNIMGVINITPDSFSDGGFYASPENAFQKALDLLNDGADILDVGAESTRPFANPVSPKEEWRRLDPILSRLEELKQNKPFLLSVDTRHPETMERCLSSSVDIINNIGELPPQDLLRSFVKHGVRYLGMHMHKTPDNMQISPLRGLDAYRAVKDFFGETASHLLSLGFDKTQFWLDPGIGFGKDDSAIITILSQLSDLSEEFPLALGVSRKSFIGRLFDLPDPLMRDSVSHMCELHAWFAGVKLLRTHDVSTLVKLISLKGTH